MCGVILYLYIGWAHNPLGVAEDSKPCVRVERQQTRHKTPSGFCEHGGTAPATLYLGTTLRFAAWWVHPCLQNCVAILDAHAVTIGVCIRAAYSGTR